MSGNGSTWMVMAFGTAMAVAGGIQLGQVGSPPFNYATASLADRTAFLERHSKEWRRQIKRRLISPSGVGPSFRLKETKVNASARHITFDIRVSGGRLAGGSRARKAKSTFYTKICPGFVNSELGRNDVTLTQRFVGSRDGRTMMRIPLSRRICGRYVLASR